MDYIKNSLFTRINSDVWIEISIGSRSSRADHFARHSGNVWAGNWKLKCSVITVMRATIMFDTNFCTSQLHRRIIKFVCLRVRAAAAGLRWVCDFWTPPVYRKYYRTKFDEILIKTCSNPLGNIEKTFVTYVFFGFACLILCKHVR